MNRLGFGCTTALVLAGFAGCGGRGDGGGAGGSAGAVATGGAPGTGGALGTGGSITGGGPGTGGTPATGGAPATGGMAGMPGTGGAPGGAPGTGGMAGTPGTGGTGAGGSPPVDCGNGSIEAPEQCDDGGNMGLDGCDAFCNYETYFRLNFAALVKGPTPGFCPQAPANALGNAVSDLAIGQLSDALSGGIGSGSTNILMQALQLDDLTGQNDPSFELGITSGSTDDARGMWPGDPADPMDWWFLLDPLTLDANNLPTGRIASSVTGGVINGGPGTAALALEIDGSPARLEMVNAGVQGRFDPPTSVPMPPPDMLAPGIVVAETITASGPGEGLCGGVTVESLSQIPVPGALATGGGITACAEGFTECGPGGVDASCNSLLDVFVRGCTVLILPAVTATQPDILAGGPAPLTVGPNNKVPDSETAGNRNAYTAYLQFNARRAHATGLKTN